METSMKKIIMMVLVIIMLAALIIPNNFVLAASGFKAPFDKGRTFMVTGTHDRAGGRHALDFGMANQNVLAMKSGTIVYAGWDSTGGGNMIRIDHGDGTYALYLHLASFYKTSGRVNQGDLIAKSGNTGNGVYHLHVAVKSNNGTELPIIFDEVGRELIYGNYLTSANGGGGVYVFNGGVSSLYQDQNWGRANLRVCANNLNNQVVYVRFFRPGREWKYNQRATSNCVTFLDMDGAGPLNGNTTYYSQAALNQEPNPNWPIPCAGPSGGQGLCDAIRRP